MNMVSDNNDTNNNNTNNNTSSNTNSNTNTSNNGNSNSSSSSNNNNTNYPTTTTNNNNNNNDADHEFLHQIHEGGEEEDRLSCRSASTERIAYQTSLAERVHEQTERLLSLSPRH
eukprot:CAMPEP_0206566658 /NCGR_PEP_ID=MMETSP0325_2-20121206/24790_1 /ASSEMBLY_ACC=CAM_ASM_000347 /TAXON_ID=2866 /ORGANISM="Crypthecodinium cohnii, Strain Seligo" /LENGTH=114 /DNA_ID=CAMNT_0054069731 /DNA_START=374 /DNA_END=715 /DNA_ORIENTATION=+